MAKFSILKWNGNYGGKAVFVVQDNSNKKQSLFTPGRVKDVTWVDKDLAGEMKDWENFENEPIENLSDVIF